MCATHKVFHFEISGYCNAHCAYCHSGVVRPAKAKFVHPALFSDTLKRLIAKQVLPPKAVIRLYNWGEPLLHPQLKELIGIINNLGLRYALSTNASRLPCIDRDFVRNLDHISFSMPGFSQDSYNRIHGFRFPEITRNITRIIHECREQGFRGKFNISFHVYRFNVAEIKLGEHFADSLRINFKPYYAILNHWNEMYAYIQGTLAPARRAAAERDLFTLEGIDQALATAQKTGYHCPQNDFLQIDEHGQVIVCGLMARDNPGYACGSTAAGHLEQSIAKAQEQPICQTCIGSGLAHYLHNTMHSPAFYRPSAYQRLLRLRDHINDFSFAHLNRALHNALAQARKKPFNPSLGPTLSPAFPLRTQPQPLKPTPPSPARLGETTPSTSENHQEAEVAVPLHHLG